MKAKFLFVFFSFILVSCNSTNNSSNSNNETIKKSSEKITLKPWVGKDIVEVLKHPKYGTPSKKEKVGKNEIISYMEYFSASGHLSDNSINVNLFCKRSFIFNSESKIIDTIEEGNCQNTIENLPIEEIKK